jgi:hypothetical protein
LKVKYKSDGTPIGTPDSKFEGTLMCTLLNETSNYDNLIPSEFNTKSETTPMSTPTSKSDGTSISTPYSKSDGTPMGTPFETPNSKSDCTPMGPPYSKMRVAHQDKGAIHSEWHNKMRLVHQDKIAFHSQLKMTKIEELYPAKIGTMRNVQVPVKVCGTPRKCSRGFRR